MHRHTAAFTLAALTSVSSLAATKEPTAQAPAVPAAAESARTVPISLPGHRADPGKDEVHDAARGAVIGKDHGSGDRG